MTPTLHLASMRPGDDIEWLDAFGLPCTGQFIHFDGKAGVVTVQSDDSKYGEDIRVRVQDVIFGVSDEEG